MGLVSVYHELKGERHGEETIPTHYWRVFAPRHRRKDGPTYHIDYVFALVPASSQSEPPREVAPQLPAFDNHSRQWFGQNNVTLLGRHI